MGTERFRHNPDGTQAVRRVGRWLLGEELGRGSYGVVYLAHPDAGGTPVALKQFRAAGQGDEEALARFEQEAAIASRLEHPGLVRVVDAGRQGGLPWMAMEYCLGPTLRDRLRSGPLPPVEAGALVAEIARAVAHAHAHGIVHRDIKPANVILDLRAGGRPRLTDFGLARDRVGGRSLTATGEAVGTPYYMAPEQVLGEPADAQVDVWALGVLLYECLTGQRPFRGETALEVGQAILDRDPVPPAALVPAVPPALEAVCLRALRRPRRERWALASELAAALEAALAGRAPPRVEGGQRLRRLALAGLLALLVSSSAATGVLLWLRARPAEATPGEPAGTAGLRAAVEQALARKEGAAEALAAAEAAAAGEPELLARVRLARAELAAAHGEAEGALERVGGLAAASARDRLEGRRLRAWALGELGRREAQEVELEGLAAADARGAVGLLAVALLERLREEGDGEEPLRRALACEPAWRPARLLRARLHLERRDLTSAARELAALEAERGDDLELLLLRALEAELADGAGARRAALDRAAALGTGPRTALRLRAELALSRGDAPAALADAQALLRRDPEDPVGVLLLGLSRLAAGTLPEPAPVRAALSRDPRAARELLLACPPELGEGLLARSAWLAPGPATGPSEALRRRLQRRAAAAVPAAREALAEALLRAAEGAGAEAVAEALVRARLAAPGDPVVQLEAARLLAGRDGYQEAEAALEAALASGSPSRPELLRLRAEVMWRRGRIRASLPLFAEAAAADPGGPDGLLAAAQGDYLAGAHLEEAARERLETALDRVRRLPSHPRALGLRAMFLSHAQPRVALLCADRALELAGREDAQLLTWRAFAGSRLALLERRPPADFRAEFAPALRASPGGYHRLGAALAALDLPGQDAWVDELLADALALEPQRAAAWQARGFVLALRRAPSDQVDACWRRAREVDPGEPLFPAWIAVYRERYRRGPPPEALPGR